MRVGRSEASLDLYGVLGVPRDATERRIRAAHRALVLELHPDRGGDEARLKLVNLAAAVLTNPESRAKYDLLRGTAPRPTWPTAAPSASVPPPPRGDGKPIVWPKALRELDLRTKRVALGVAAALLVSIGAVVAAEAAPGPVPVSSSEWKMPKGPSMQSHWAE